MERVQVGFGRSYKNSLHQGLQKATMNASPRFHFVAFELSDGSSEYFLVQRQDRPKIFPVIFPKGGRAFYVGENKRDGSRWCLRRSLRVRLYFDSVFHGVMEIGVSVPVADMMFLPLMVSPDSRCNPHAMGICA